MQLFVTLDFTERGWAVGVGLGALRLPKLQLHHCIDNFASYDLRWESTHQPAAFEGTPEAGAQVRVYEGTIMAVQAEAGTGATVQEPFPLLESPERSGWSTTDEAANEDESALVGIQAPHWPVKEAIVEAAFQDKAAFQENLALGVLKRASSDVVITDKYEREKSKRVHVGERELERERGREREGGGEKERYKKTSPV